MSDIMKTENKNITLWEQFQNPIVINQRYRDKINTANRHTHDDHTQFHGFVQIALKKRRIFK